MYCNKCGNRIAEKAQFCEHCGQLITTDIAAENRKKNIVGLILGVFAGLMVVAAIMVTIYGLDSESPTNHQTSSSVGTSNPYTETQTNSNIHSEGMYKVGTDIEAGEYFVYCTNSISCYWAVSSDSSGELTSIVANDNIETFAFVSVSDGQYLEVGGGKFMKASDANVPNADSDGTYGAGMYRVGIDVPAGEYKVVSNSALGGYVEVSSDSSGSIYSIVSNDLVDTFSYITVTEGQYLTVTRAHFALVE